MSFKLNDLLKQGVVNLFSTEENNNYVLILAFKNKTFVVDLVSNKSGNIAYVDPAKGYDPTEIINLQDFVTTKLNKVYSSIAKFDFLQVSPAPARSNAIKSYIISRGNKADSKILDKILTDNGYDISKLYKSITATSTVRDYSLLIASSKEAQDNLKANEEKLKTMNATVKTTPGAELLEKAIRNGRVTGALLVGPAGTGKSILGNIFARDLGAPIFTMQIDDGTQSEHLLGTYVPSESEKGYKFVPGILLRAYSEGWMILLNEVNMGHSEVLCILNQFLDDTPSITVYGKEFKKHPNFVLIATENPGYEGTNSLNPALKSRFMVLGVDSLEEKEFVSRMISYSHNVCHNDLSVDFFKKLYAYSAHVGKVNQENEFCEDVEFCIRNAQHLVDLILSEQCNEKDFIQAVKMAYLNSLTIDNDNMDKVASLVKNADEQAKIKDLYNSYDYRQQSTVVPESNYEDLVEETGSKRSATEFDDEDLEAMEDGLEDLEVSVQDVFGESEDED